MELKKNHKIIIVIVAILALLIMVYFIYQYIQKQSTPPLPGSNTITKQPGLLDTLLSSTWFHNIFSSNGGGGGTNNGSGCIAGQASVDNPCIDDCGFPISSDQNPLCA